MIVVSFGVRKSGSTLAFEMAKAVLELSGFPQEMLPDGVVEPDRKINIVRTWTDVRLARLLEATAGKKIVVKTHGSPDQLSVGALLGAIESRDVQIHVVYRDPRDAVLSMLDHGARSRENNRPNLRQIVDVDDAIEALGPDVASLRRWGVFESLKLQYGRFAFDRVEGPRAMADALGVEVDPDEVWERLDGRPTKKNVARPNRHTTEMSPADAARIAAAFPDYLGLVEHDDHGWFCPTP